MLRFALSKPDDASQGMDVFGPPVDCWAYGLTAFKLLTCRTLFKAPEDAPLDDTGTEMDDDAWNAWQARCIADLHADWVGATITFGHIFLSLSYHYHHPSSV